MEIINVFLREREALEMAKRTIELLEQEKAKLKPIKEVYSQEEMNEITKFLSQRLLTFSN